MIRLGEGEAEMRLVDGRYECIYCGEILDIAKRAVPVVIIKSGSGKPSMRSLLVDGKEIHACPAEGIKAPWGR
jgi:hypothetical protein